MATPLDQKYQLFIPGKSKKDVEQPSYGTDMRTIEQWAAFLIDGIHGSNATLAAEILALQTIINAQTPDIKSYQVGGAGPAGTPIQTQTFTVSVNFTAGAGTIALAGFAHGYNAVISAVDTTPAVSIRTATSSLSDLGVTAIDTITGAGITGTVGISVVIIGS
jgi:hypothetical protein